MSIAKGGTVDLNRRGQPEVQNTKVPGNWRLDTPDTTVVTTGRA